MRPRFPGPTGGRSLAALMLELHASLLPHPLGVSISALSCRVPGVQETGAVRPLAALLDHCFRCVVRGGH
jgi:hypothetical protein